MKRVLNLVVDVNSIIRRVITFATQTTATRLSYTSSSIFIYLFLFHVFLFHSKLLLKTESIWNFSSVVSITCFSAFKSILLKNHIRLVCRVALFVTSCYSVNPEYHFNSIKSFRFGWRVLSFIRCLWLIKNCSELYIVFYQKTKRVKTISSNIQLREKHCTKNDPWKSYRRGEYQNRTTI